MLNEIYIIYYMLRKISYLNYSENFDNILKSSCNAISKQKLNFLS